MSVQVWQIPRGAWRWRYVDPPAGRADAGSRADLENLTDHPSADEAAHAARTAYPDARVEVVTAPLAGAESRWRLWAGRVALAVVVVLAARRALQHRRRRVRP